MNLIAVEGSLQFFITDIREGVFLHHSYSPFLVALALVIAIGGSALSFYVQRVALGAERADLRYILKIAGTATFGVTVWSMHFIGMLSFYLCASVSYDITKTIESSLPGMFSGWALMHWSMKKHSSPGSLFLGGAMMGAGIGLMHYSGMLAMKMSATLRFDPLLFVLSILVAMILSFIGLWVRCCFLKIDDSRRVLADLTAALVMGLAVTTMHYLGMSAARFSGIAEVDQPIPPVDFGYLALLISTGASLILGFVGFWVFTTKLRVVMDSLVIRDFELNTIVESSSDAIITLKTGGRIRTFNHRFTELFGCTDSFAAGSNLSSFLPEARTLLSETENQAIYQTTGVRADGMHFPIRVSLTRHGMAGSAYFVGFLTDLSEFMRIQQRAFFEAHHDCLTGLHNRRYFDEQFKLEIERSRRSGLPLSLIMVDIDHFKKINDQYGHLVGDRLLVFLTDDMRKRLRAGDILVRYGGEEFLVILPDTGPVNAMKVAEDLRLRIERLKLIECGKVICATVSLGVTSVAGNFPDKPEDLVNQADRALYEAKRSGRNRTHLFRIQS